MVYWFALIKTLGWITQWSSFKSRNRSVCLYSLALWKLYFYLARHLAKKNQKGRLPVKQDMQRLNCSFRPAWLLSSATPLKLYSLASVDLTVHVRRPKQSPKRNRKGRDHPESGISDIHDSRFICNLDLEWSLFPEHGTTIAKTNKTLPKCFIKWSGFL